MWKTIEPNVALSAVKPWNMAIWMCIYVYIIINNRHIKRGNSTSTISISMSQWTKKKTSIHSEWVCFSQQRLMRPEVIYSSHFPNTKWYPNIQKMSHFHIQQYCSCSCYSCYVSCCCCCCCCCCWLIHHLVGGNIWKFHMAMDNQQFVGHVYYTY